MKVLSLLALSGAAGLAGATNGQTFSYRAVHDSSNLCTEALESAPTVPFIAFTMTGSSADSEAMSTVKDWIPQNTESLHVNQFFDSAISRGASALADDSVLNIFVDEMSTASFLRESGSFGDKARSNENVTQYGALRNFLISQHPQHFVEIHEHANASSFHELMNQAAALAEQMGAKFIVVTARKPSKLGDIPESASVTEFEAVSSGHLELPVQRPAVVLLDMASLTNSKGDFVLDYMRQTLHERSSRIGIFTAIVPQDVAEVIGAMPRMLQAGPTPLKEIRVQPFQLAIILTLAFATLMLIMMTCCINSIDTPTQFEDKTLEITKEY